MKVAFVYLFILMIVMALADHPFDITAKWPCYPLVWIGVLALCFMIDVLIESRGPTAIISVVCMILFGAMAPAYKFAPTITDRIPHFHPIIWGALATAIVTHIMVHGRAQMLYGLPSKEREKYKER